MLEAFSTRKQDKKFYSAAIGTPCRANMKTVFIKDKEKVGDQSPTFSLKSEFNLTRLLKAVFKTLRP